MGANTTNDYFYKPSLGASGTAELALFDAALDATDLVIKANVDGLAGKQPLDAGLTSIAGLTTAANKMIYTTALDTYAIASLTAFARSILDDADEATFKATVNLEIGTDVQAFDNALTSISGLTYVSASFIKLTANDTYAVRTLAQTLSDIGGAASGSNSDITALTGLTTPLGTAYGGTGVANNAASTLTVSGNFATTFTVTEATGITLPASGTLATTAVAILSSLTSIGTIATGTWEATDIGLAHGGTGVSTGAMVNFTSILNAALYIGRDADNTINFATDNTIIFKTNGKATGALIGSTGELDMNNNTIGFTQQTVSYDVTTTTVDWKLGNKATMTFGAGNIGTFAFTNPTNPCNVVLKVIQDGTGSRVVTAWDADIKWASGSAPTLTTGANTIDVISFYWDGTNYFGVASLAFS